MSQKFPSARTDKRTLPTWLCLSGANKLQGPCGAGEVAMLIEWLPSMHQASGRTPELYKLGKESTPLIPALGKLKEEDDVEVQSYSWPLSTIKKKQQRGGQVW